jgi:hemoglobin
MASLFAAMKSARLPAGFAAEYNVPDNLSINHKPTFKNSTMTTPTPYSLIGGEQAILSLVDRFYFYMDTLPEAQGIRAIHQPSLASAKDKLFKFISGWLDGPNLFVEEFGHPMLRARHLPFAIGEPERDQWLLCMNKALAEMTMDPRLKANIQEALQHLATHMINQESEAG